MDRILIRELGVLGILGAYESEREQPREIVIDLDLFMDLRPAGQSDDLADCLNYDEVITLISEHVATLNRFTVEALATDITELVLSFPRVQKVRVVVQKPGAVDGCRSVGVEIERSRPVTA